METSITYYTIQHLYINGNNRLSEDWTFSNFDNIASAAISKEHLRIEAHEIQIKAKTKGFKSIETGLEALNLVILDNIKKHNKHKFRLVEIVHTFDVITIIN